MKPRHPIFMLGALAGLGLASAPAGAQVIIPTSTPTPAATAAPAGGEGVFTLELVQDRTGHVVRMRDLIKLLDLLFPAGVSNTWNPLEEVLHLEIRGRRFDLPARRAVVLVDERPEVVDRPLILRQGEVLVPVASVEFILKTTGVEFEINAPAGAQPTPTAPPAGVTLGEPTTMALRADQPATRPLDFSSAADRSGQTTGGMTTPASSPTTRTAVDPALPLVMMPRPAERATTTAPILSQPPGFNANAGSLEPPPALAGRIDGLTWGQLADVAHREPPSRMTLVCDAALEPVARQAATLADRESGLTTTVIVAPKARGEVDPLALRIAQTSPQLLIDLIADPRPTGFSSGVPPFHVWVVHEFLWPRDPTGAAAASDPDDPPYRRHEFQNLAFGSLLRAELVRQFPDRLVRYDLAPLGLLERVDAPAAALLVPVGAGGGDASALNAVDAERIGRALASGVAGYVRGMMGVRF